MDRPVFDSRVRSKAFIVMTVLVPVFLGAYMFAVPILTRSRTSNRRLAAMLLYIAVLINGQGYARHCESPFAARPELPRYHDHRQWPNHATCESDGVFADHPLLSRHRVCGRVTAAALDVGVQGPDRFNRNRRSKQPLPGIDSL